MALSHLASRPILRSTVPSLRAIFMKNNIITKEIFDEETKENLKQWLEGDYDENTKKEIRRLLQENPKEIVDAFFTRLSFGTSGIRGIMGVGSNRMNIYNLGAYIQGLCNYLHKQPKVQSEHSVLIGYDSRHHSREFAEHAAKILAANGIKALLLKAICPTPLISFGCRLKECSAGLMITASHNPPQYNGCKIYWNDGAQVLPPHDLAIMDEAKSISDPRSIHLASSLDHDLIEYVGSEIEEAYLDMISRLQNYREDNQLDGIKLNIVYTSLHGVGITLCPKALLRWGFTSIHLVEKQVIPDGNFPTTPFPNPEEPSALNLGIEKLKETKSDILIANDPDGDRVGVAVSHHGEIRILTGNQIGVLLLEHICEALLSRNKMAANGAFIKTMTASEMFSAISNYYQKPCFNVLPGFKHISEKIRLWENDSRGRQFIFAADECYGYLLNSNVREKDAICISALICEMALQAKLKGKTLVDQLYDLYRRHGIYHEEIFILKFDDSKAGKAQMDRCMTLLQRRPPKKINDHQVLILEDYRRSVRINFTTHQSDELSASKADILVFWLNDDCKLAIRPSGTEAKIKIYCGVVCKQFSTVEEGLKVAKKHAESLIEGLQKLIAEDQENF